MQCYKYIGKDDNGNALYKQKKAHKTQDEAIAAAKIVNSQNNVISKVVPYKCSECHFYHIGRSGNQLTEKYRNKLQTFKKYHI